LRLRTEVQRRGRRLERGMLFDDCEIERSRERMLIIACFCMKRAEKMKKKKRVCGYREKMYIGFP
ncbi:hypothetical protein, partial [Chlorobium sp. N1]|uniref:hypothetical protein n=1 Tax=Chlorobium sp. N1 TaxID=2491138 RepID=UPI001A953174